MKDKVTLVERLAYHFKGWQIIVMGLVACIIGTSAVGLLAQLGYDALPLVWWTPLILAHLGGTMAAVWFIGRPFVEAYILADLWARSTEAIEVRSLFPDVED